MMEIRFHGRGGQGAKIASRIVGRSGFLSGLHAQDFALFGAERRGAPVVSCARLSEEPIDRRGYVDEPDLVVVIDESLLAEARAQVFHGVRAATPVFINGPARDQSAKDTPAAKLIYLDLGTIARRILGQAIVSAAAAGVAAKSARVIPLELLAEGVKLELAEFGLSGELVEKNALVAREAFALTPPVALDDRAEVSRPAGAILESVPRLNSAQFAGPAIRHPASAALRDTGNWRVERPEIALAKCKRCFLCYLYCPDTAILLDRENFPHVDYSHCKGCMICYQECPTDAITRRWEV